MAGRLESDNFSGAAKDDEIPSLAENVYGTLLAKSSLPSALTPVDKHTAVKITQISPHSMLNELETNLLTLTVTKGLLLAMSRKPWSSRLLLSRLWRRFSHGSTIDGDMGDNASSEDGPSASLRQAGQQGHNVLDTTKKYCVGLPLDLLHCTIDPEVTLRKIGEMYFGLKNKTSGIVKENPFDNVPKSEPSVNPLTPNTEGSNALLMENNASTESKTSIQPTTAAMLDEWNNMIGEDSFESSQTPISPSEKQAEPAKTPPPAEEPISIQLQAEVHVSEAPKRVRRSSASDLTKPKWSFNFDRYEAQAVKPAKGQKINWNHRRNGEWWRSYMTTDGLGVNEIVLPNGDRSFDRSDGYTEIYLRRGRQYEKIN